MQAQHITRKTKRIFALFLFTILIACDGAGDQFVAPTFAEPVLTNPGTGHASLRLANEGGGQLTFEVTSSDARIVISPNRGSLGANQARTLDVRAECGEGQVAAELTVSTSSAAAPVALPLTMACGAVAEPMWWLSADTLTVDGYSTRPQLSAQEVTRRVTLSNSGRAKGRYTLTSDRPWLTAAPASGELGMGSSTSLELTIRPCTEPTRERAQLTVQGGGSSTSLTVVRDCDVKDAAMLDLAFERFYINQAVPAADSARPPHERRALIAARSGLARAFVRANQLNAQTPTVRLHYRTPDETGHLDLTGPTSVPTKTDEGDLGSTFNVTVAEHLLVPGLEVAVEIDPDNHVAERDEVNNRYPASGFVALEVLNTPALNLTLVPVRYQGNAPTLDEAAQKDLLKQTHLMYPLSDINVTVRAPYTFSGTLAPNKDGGWNTLLSQLTSLRAVDGSTDLYYGVVEPGYSSGIAGVGWVGGSPVSVGWNRPVSRSKVMAHELGHNWERTHAPCSVSGDKHYPHNEGRIGVWGFDSSTQTLKNPDQNRDIMGYCNPTWISDYTYDGILAHRQGHAYSVQSQSFTADALIVSGTLKRGVLTLNPVLRAKATVSAPTPGPYTLIGTDSVGHDLFSVPFSTQRVADTRDPAAGFNLTVPLQDAEGLTRLRVERSGEVLAEAHATLRTQAARATNVMRAGNQVILNWDEHAYDAVVVRDAAGTVLTIDESGEVTLETAGRSLELTFSDGLRTHQEVVTF